MSAPLRPATGPARSRAGRLARAAALVAASCLAAELGLRAWLAVQGTPYSGAAAETELRAAAAGMELPVGPDGPREGDPLPGAVPHPFFGWDRKDALETYTRVAEYFARPDAREAFDIVFVGGNLARAVAEQGRERILAALRSDPRFADRPVTVRYLGQPAFKQPQQVDVLTYAQALGWQPDLVVDLDGHNELALGGANLARGVHPAQPSAAHWAHLDRSEGSDGIAMDRLLDAYEARKRALGELSWLGRGWIHSCLLSARARGRFAGLRDEFEEQVAAFEALTSTERPLGVCGPPIRGDFDLELARMVGQWARSARMLDAICKAHSCAFLHVLEPSALDVGAGALAPSFPAPETLGDQRRAVEAGYPLMRREGARLAADGLPFFDASRLFERRVGACFVGSNELTPDGTATLAEQVALAFLALRETP